MEKLYRDKGWLENKYSKGQISDPEIAKLCNVSQVTISFWRKRFNIITRSHSLGSHLVKSNYCNLSKEARDWINGALLGDGYLQKISNYSAQIYYGSSKKKYIQYVSNTLDSFGIKQTGRIKKHYYEKWNCSSYYYSSLTYVELLPIRQKWYPKGKKIVPRDIELTPITCQQWYIGDGSLSHQRNYNSYIALCTEGFPISDVEFLKEKLIKLGFKVTRHADNTLYISTKSVPDFLDYIGLCPVKCYQYKWNLNKKGGVKQ